MSELVSNNLHNCSNNRLIKILPNCLRRKASYYIVVLLPGKKCTPVSVCCVLFTFLMKILLSVLRLFLFLTIDRFLLNDRWRCEDDGTRQPRSGGQKSKNIVRMIVIWILVYINRNYRWREITMCIGHESFGTRIGKWTKCITSKRLANLAIFFFAGRTETGITYVFQKGIDTNQCFVSIS